VKQNQPAWPEPEPKGARIRLAGEEGGGRKSVVEGREGGQDCI